ncbi:MAG: glycosyltransferase family 2 protein [Anaerolineae bacterium]|nr:glycosyltransferase family 2 protein [Anaerolineae bacterium]
MATPEPSQSGLPAFMVTLSLIVHDDFSHIGQALDCVFSNMTRVIRVVVTINRGNAEQTDALSAAYPAVRLVVNPTPKGFAANHNAVMREADTSFIALLNDDALLQPGALDRMLDYLGQHPACGIVGPVVRNPDGTPQVSAFSDPTLPRMLFHVSGLSRFTKSDSGLRRLFEGRTKAESLNSSTETRIVPVVVGVCMVVRREAIQQAGLMDEDTLMYGEEFGWQRRLREKGWNAALVGEAEVIHLNQSQDLSGWRLAEHRKGMLTYFIRYQPPWQSLILRGAISFFHGLYALLWWPVDRARSISHWRACGVGWNWKPAL